jgi:LysM repeat protein
VSSLSNHLREAESHGRLPFHPSCPVCRGERLRGSLVGDAILGQRARAGLLAATLALSSLGLPVSALAQSDPASPPAAPAPDGNLDRVDSDDATQPDNPAAEDDAPIGGENLIEPDPDDLREEPDATPLSELPPEQPGEEIDVAPEPEAQPETAPAPVAPAVPVTPAPQPTPAPTPPLPVPPVQPTTPPPAGELVERPEGESAGGKTRRVLIGVESNPPTVRERSQTSLGPAEPNLPAAPADEPTPPLAATRVQAAEPSPATSAGAATVPVSQPTSARPREIHGDTYTVRPGDSLWSIARRLLGNGASPAEVAREVNRLWELNRERIATGDPDLLMVGTKLRLR